MHRRNLCGAVLLCALTVAIHGTLAQLPSPTPLPSPSPDPTQLIQQINAGDPLPTPLPTPSPTTTPVAPDQPTPPPEVGSALETDNDTTTIANGLVTTFHGGNPLIASGSTAQPTPLPAQQRITITTTSGDTVPLSPGLLLIDKQGNIVDPTTVQPGTRMQALREDDPADPVIYRVMVDQG